MKLQNLNKNSKKPHKFGSNEKKQELIQLIKNNVPLAQIARHYQVHTSTILRQMRSLGIERPKTRIEKILNKEEILSQKKEEFKEEFPVSVEVLHFFIRILNLHGYQVKKK